MTTLCRYTYRLGRGLDAIVTIDEDSPTPMPLGVDWDAELDHVRIAATVILPTDVGWSIHSDLLASNVHVAGYLVAHNWGERCPVGRQCVVRLGAATLDEAISSVRRKLECDFTELRDHVATRDARIQLREARLARGRAVRPPAQELVARFDVTGLPLGEVAALAAEVVAQGEQCGEHPNVTVRVEMPNGIPTHCVDPTDDPTARVRVRVPAPERWSFETSDEEFIRSKASVALQRERNPDTAVPEESDDWGQPVTPRSGPPV